MSKISPKAIHRYAFAALAVACATILQIAFSPLLGDRLLLLAYLGAILVVVRNGGMGPVCFAIILSLLAMSTPYVPIFNSQESLLADLLACALFLAFSMFLARRMMAEAQQSQSRLSMFLDNSTTVAWMKNLAGEYVYVNEPFANIYGDYPRKYRGLTDHEIWPEIADQLVANDREVLANNKPMEYVEDVPTPDGVLRKWRVYKFPFTGEGGTKYVGGIAFDITEQSQQEAALRKSEARIRRIVDSNTIGICFWTRQGPLLDANDAFLEIVGYTHDDLEEGKLDWRALTPADQIHRDEAALQQIFRTGTCPTFEKEYIRKDGSRVPVLLGGANFDDAGEEGVAFALDLSERKRAEAALRESEERFSLFMKHLPGFAHMKDEHLRIMYLNEAYEENLHINRQEWIGKLVNDLLPAEAAATLQQNDRWVLEHNAPLRTYEEVPLADGLHRYLTYRFPIPDQSGHRLLGGISIDMTEQWRAEEERRRLEERIQHTQKLESLGILAGGIAHDFNNLLMGILGYASLVLEEVPADSPIRESVRQIEIAALRAAELTNQMLAYSGRGKFVIEPVNLSQLVEEMTHLLRVSMSKTATLRCELEPNLPIVEADAGQIRQIVMNLIVNASDAIGDREGTIRLRTGVMYADRTSLESSALPEIPAEGNYVFVEVADTGMGMDAETKSRIFDPFFTTKMTGRGLGLAAVQGIVRGHRGAIQCQSTPGKGTTFRVLLPISQSRAEIQMPARSGNGSVVACKGTVLIVDDDEMVRVVARRIIERAGYNVITAVDGRDGVEVFQAHAAEISVVLLDMTMPRLNGDEALKLMRQTEPNVRVILTSGYNETEISERFSGEGLAGFIQKPYRSRELLEKLQAVLASSD